MDKKRAVALKYKKKETAPRIVAKGTNKVADLIIKIARENGIHVEENPILSETLMQFDVGDYIPEEVYDVVAQILAFVLKLRLGESNGDEKDKG